MQFPSRLSIFEREGNCFCFLLRALTSTFYLPAACYALEENKNALRLCRRAHFAFIEVPSGLLHDPHWACPESQYKMQFPSRLSIFEREGNCFCFLLRALTSTFYLPAACYALEENKNALRLCRRVHFAFIEFPSGLLHDLY